MLGESSVTDASLSGLLEFVLRDPALRGVVDSAAAGIIRPVLVGPEKKIRDTASKCGLGISGFEISTW